MCFCASQENGTLVEKIPNHSRIMTSLSQIHLPLHVCTTQGTISDNLHCPHFPLEQLWPSQKGIIYGRVSSEGTYSSADKTQGTLWFLCSFYLSVWMKLISFKCVQIVLKRVIYNLFLKSPNITHKNDKVYVTYNVSLENCTPCS
jgi:hypothetical protein